MDRLSAPATYEELREAVTRAGCFEPRPGVAIASVVAHLTLSPLLFAASARVPNSGAAIALFLLASLLFYRLGWIMHDAAHGAALRGAAANRAFAAIVSGLLGEFPSGWRYGHNRHHAAPNVRGRDMDQSERWDPERRYRTWLGAFVGILLLSRYRGHYVPKSLVLLALRDGYFCRRYAPSRFRAELAASLCGVTAQITLFVALFGAAGLALFFAHTCIGLVYLNAIFAGNHYDIDSFDEADAQSIPFDELQVRTSRNYAGGALVRFGCGGLENQIEHHLFPDMPRRGLVRAAPIVRAFCERRGLPYRVEPFSRCVAGVVRFHLLPPRPVVRA